MHWNNLIISNQGTYIHLEFAITQPLGKLSSFLEDPRAFDGRGRPSPGGLGGSEKHIWKIFYRGDPEIGTQGLGMCRQVCGLLW